MPFGYSAIGGLLQDMEATKRRMQAPLAPPPDAFQLPQQGMPQGAPLAPSLAPEPPSSAFANIANANISDARDPTHGHKRGLRGGLLHLIGADRVPKEVAALLTPDQVERVKPGVIGSLWNAINYGVGPQTVMQKRAENITALQDKQTLKEQLAALRQKYAGGDFRQFAAELAMLRPELAGPLSGMVNAMEPPRAVNPPSAPALQREDNVLGEDGKPYIVWTDAQGKEVKRERQYVAPQAPREDNTIVPVLDPADPEKKRVIYVPRAQAVGMERPSAGAGGINGQAATNRLVAENDKQIGVIDSALSELRKYPKAVGMNRGLGLVPGMGNFADEFNQRRDPEGVKLRALIANISSLKIKDRSGAAVTISEFPRLVPFIPLVTNTPEAIKTKLEQLKAEIALHNKELREESGGGSAAKVPSFEEWKAGRKP